MKIKKETEKANKTELGKKCYTQEETCRILGHLLNNDSEPRMLFDKLAREVIPKLMDGTDMEKFWARSEIGARSEEVIMALGLSNHYHLIPTADKQYAALVLSMTRQIEKDFDCNTAIEKAIVEAVTMAYIKMVDSSRIFSDWSSNGGNIELKDRIKYLEMMSRQMDRVCRQFMTGYALLKQMKQPSLKVTIKTKNAFVAQNQQINNSSKSNENI